MTKCPVCGVVSDGMVLHEGNHAAVPAPKEKYEKEKEALLAKYADKIEPADMERIRSSMGVLSAIEALGVEDIIEWADGEIGALGTEYGKRGDPRAARVAFAIRAALDGSAKGEGK